MAQTVEKKEKRIAPINLMEVLAEEMLRSMIQEQKSRFSPRAIQDIKALALNRLWPMYTTSESGKSFLKKVVVAEQIEKDIERELRTAIAKVRSNPRN